ncbi:hypothetical protein BJ742DRAFT_742471 [Cladochytrium replicatum]|nr:hypothetical protein BJ742DRAFT_742471 [Cladochytrium replicatum]
MSLRSKITSSPLVQYILMWSRSRIKRLIYRTNLRTTSLRWSTPNIPPGPQSLRYEGGLLQPPPRSRFHDDDIEDSVTVETSTHRDDLDSCLVDVSELKRSVLDALARVREVKAQCAWAMSILEERAARAAWDSVLDVEDFNDAVQIEEP